MKKGIEFIAIGEISPEAHAKIEKMKLNKENEGKKMKEDYESGKFDDIINLLKK